MIAYKIDTCIKFELYEEKVMKVLKKIWVPVLIAIILIAFGGAVYYQKAVVPKKEIDKKAGITSGKLDDYITLGEYKGLSCEVTQDDIDESIKEETQTYTEVDREAKEGDCVEITYTGYVDGEKDKNISQSNCELYVGQEESLYAEFTNAVVGHKAGDKVEYQAKDTDDINYVAEKDSDYTGKNVKFTLKLVSVSEEETEDVTDKWVKDNYNEDYISKLKEYDRNDNPIFVPEAVALFRGEKWSGPAKAFYTLAEYDAICFSPFAIDNYSVYNEKHPLREAYKVLKNLMPLIVKKHGTGQMRGFMQQENRSDKIDFGDYEMNIHYHATEPYEGYGLVIRLSEDEFLVSGYGINVSFNSKDRKRPGISYGTLREGYFVDGEWKTLKYLGGDEAMQGVGGVKMPSVYTDAERSPDLITTVIIKVIPVEK